MALQPLLVARPAVSLIGGSELPKASGAGVPVPDLSNVFSQLANKLMAQANQNQAIDDEIAAKADVEAWRGTQNGKDPLGAYTRVPPINGTPVYRANAINSLEQNAISDIAGVHNTAAGEIQAEIGTPVGDKLARIKAHGQGILDTIAPEYRQLAREYLQRDFIQRENQLVADEQRMQEQALYSGIQNRIDSNFKSAISAASSGADYTQHTQEIYKALDEYVGLGKINQQEADDTKRSLGNLVVAAGVQETIANEAFAGNIGAGDIERMGMALDSGADFELSVESDYEASFINASNQPVGPPQAGVRPPPVRKKVISADEYRTLVNDPVRIKQIAADFKELGNFLAQGAKQRDKRQQVLDFLQNQGLSDPSQVIPPTLQAELDLVASEHIQGGALKDIGKVGADMKPVGGLVLLTRRARYMPPSLMDALIAKTSGTVEEAASALLIYQAITESISGDVETGNIIRDSIPAEKVARMEAMRDRLNDIMASGGDEKNRLDEWRRMQIKDREPGNTVDFWKAQFAARSGDAYGSGKLNFDTYVRDAIIEHYGVPSAGPDITGEIEEAYRTSMSLSAGADPVDTLDKTLERVFSRYTASKIFTDGIARAEKWDNPEGYSSHEQVGVALNTYMDPDQWASDMVVDQLDLLEKSGQLVLDEEISRDLDAVLAAGNPTPLGKGLLLQPLASNLNQTQFYVMLVMSDQTLERLMMRDKDGRPTPLIVDPGIVRSNIRARQSGAAVLQDIESGGTEARNRDIVKQFNASRGIDKGHSLYGVLNDAELFQKWFTTQDPQWQEKYQQGEAAREELFLKTQQRYKDLETSLPFKVSPEILMLPKAGGKAVTLGAIDAVEQLFPDGHGGQFMANVALAESNMGQAANTFRSAGDRGIWQVNDSSSGALLEVQRRARIEGDPLNIAAARAKRALGIDVVALGAADLDKPLVSALVSRFYFMRMPGAIPADPQDQAEYWRDWYNPGATDRMVANFVDMAGSVLVGEAQAGQATRVLDASGPGMVTDVAGNAFPANFTATLPRTQTSVLRLSAAFGQPLRVTAHGGRRRGGSRTSQHFHGTAVDIYVADMAEADRTRLIALAIQMGFRGIGGYAAGDGEGTIHIDLRSGGRHNGLGLWWRHKPGVDSDWRGGQKWFTDGINQGMALRGQYSA